MVLMHNVSIEMVDPLFGIVIGAAKFKKGGFSQQLKSIGIPLVSSQLAPALKVTSEKSPPS